MNIKMGDGEYLVLERNVFSYVIIENANEIQEVSTRRFFQCRIRISKYEKKFYNIVYFRADYYTTMDNCYIRKTGINVE